MEGDEEDDEEDDEEHNVANDIDDDDDGFPKTVVKLFFLTTVLSTKYQKSFGKNKNPRQIEKNRRQKPKFIKKINKTSSTFFLENFGVWKA